jgi:hypothetical protein
MYLLSITSSVVLLFKDSTTDLKGLYLRILGNRQSDLRATGLFSLPPVLSRRYLSFGRFSSEK